MTSTNNRQLKTSAQIQAEYSRLGDEIARLTGDRQHLETRLRGVKSLIKNLKQNQGVLKQILVQRGKL